MGFLSFSSLFNKRRPAKNRRPSRRLEMESLEERCVPTNTITGYVYNDVPNTGVLVGSDGPVANATVELLNSNGTPVASTTTNAQGQYTFNTENLVTPQQATMSVTYSFTPTTPLQPGTFYGSIAPFNSVLGSLESMTITQSGAIISDIAAENTNSSSTSTVSAQVKGDLALSITSDGDLINDLNFNQIVGSTVTLQAWTGPAYVRGQGLSYTGLNSYDFGSQSVSNTSPSVSPSAGDMSLFEGPNNVGLTLVANVGSTANYSGGNVQTDAESTITDTVVVTYNYLTSNAIPPGQYTIQLSPQPSPYLPGKVSYPGPTTTIILPPNIPGPQQIPVTLVGTNDTVANNNFAELLPACISGTVYVDASNSGVINNSDPTLSGVTVTLTGLNDLGNSINLTTTTGATGQYKFSGLRPGTYTVTETQPTGYLAGATNVGTVSGTTDGSEVSTVISSVVLAQNQMGINYNFGELKPACVSGYVYVDANSDGTMDAGDLGIPNAVITLTGPETLTATTNSSGQYKFSNLLPGTYALTETPVAGYNQGSNNVGKIGTVTVGALGPNTDEFSSVVLGQGQMGTNYNFGWLSPNADLSIVKTASVSTVQVSTDYTYTLTVTNLGPATANTVCVKDPLPAGTTFVNGVGPNWTVTFNSATDTVYATTPTMGNGVTSFITITVESPTYSGTVTNTATVTSKTPDPNPANNTSTVTILVTDPPGNPFPQAITPQFGNVPIFTKMQLMGGKLAPAIQALAADIESLYLTLTGSAPSGATVGNLVAGIQAGSQSLPGLVGQLWLSTQHLNQEVTSVYQSLLGQSPTSSQLAAGVSQLKAGGSELTVAASVLTSTAYSSLHPTSSSLVTSLDEQFLGGTPSLSAVLASVQGMGTWPAYVQSTLSSQQVYANLITTYYQGLFGTSPPLPQMQTWLSELEAGQYTPDQIIEQMFASSQFEQLAAANTKK